MEIIEKKELELNVLEKELGDNEIQGIITAYITTYGNIDRVKDVMVKGVFANTINDQNKVANIRVLGGHNKNAVIGKLLSLEDTEKGLIAKTAIFPEAKNEAGVSYIDLIKNQVITHMSVGFQPMEVERKNGIRYIISGDLLEFSLVSIPCNEKAQFIEVKSLEKEKTREELLMAVKSIQERDALLQDKFGFTTKEVFALKTANAICKKTDIVEAFALINKTLEATNQQTDKLFELLSLDETIDIKSFYNTQVATQGAEIVDETQEKKKKEKKEEINKLLTQIEIESLELIK